MNRSHAPLPRSAVRLRRAARALGAQGRRAGRAFTRVSSPLQRWTSSFLLAQDNYLLVGSILVGILSGLGAAAFIYALAGMHHFFFDTVAGWMGIVGAGAVVLLPALGGLLVGPFVARFAPEASGHGVPEVMTAVATRGGVIKGRVAVVKIVASALTIGSGGSAGQEGPMVQIGAAIASALGQRLKVAQRHMRTFVACGAAGGLAAVFNAPIGGAIFALEVITGELTPAFGAVILASVSATAVSRSLFGDYPSFVVPRYDLVSNWELLLYALLGLLAGVVSVAFIRMSYAIEKRFEGWEFPQRWKPFIGGLMVGLLGRFLPEVFGTGGSAIEAATWGRMAFVVMAALVLVKMLATSLTLGSGGSGGVFGPSMYVGAMLGGSFGWLVHWLLPGWTAGPGAYALVGIGALVGGTMLAPLTAIILLFEMTDDYRIILPVMEATVLAILVTRLRVGESIYTLKLRQQGIPYYTGVELERAHSIDVRSAMRREPPVLDHAASVDEALRAAVRAGVSAVVVVDEHGGAVGVAGLRRLSAVAHEAGRQAGVAEAMVAIERARTAPEDTLRDALTRLGPADVEALVVVDTDRRPVGLLTRDDVLRTYEEILRR